MVVSGAVRLYPCCSGSRVVGFHCIVQVLHSVIVEDLLEGGGVGWVQYHPVIVEGLEGDPLPVDDRGG